MKLSALFNPVCHFIGLPLHRQFFFAIQNLVLSGQVKSGHHAHKGLGSRSRKRGKNSGVEEPSITTYLSEASDGRAMCLLTLTWQERCCSSPVAFSSASSLHIAQAFLALVTSFETLSKAILTSLPVAIGKSDKTGAAGRWPPTRDLTGPGGGGGAGITGGVCR